VGRDPLKKKRSPDQHQGNTNHHTGRRALRKLRLNLSKSCVVCTFEFLISAHPNPKPTTLGIPLGGQPDKTRHISPLFLIKQPTYSHMRYISWYLHEIFFHLLHLCIHIQQCSIPFLYAHFIDQTSTDGLASPLKQLEIASWCLIQGVVARYMSINVIFFCKICAPVV
jgi:hypothetical protein